MAQNVLSHLPLSFERPIRRQAMASDRQIEANRRNALASTGPRTDAGKAISRRNAITHGLTADQLLLDGEDPAVFEMLREDIFDEYAPATAYEAELTHRIATLSWRLRRIDVFEAAILKWMAYRQVEIHDKEKIAESSSFFEDHHNLPWRSQGPGRCQGPECRSGA